jgi:hypothetical protein
MVKISLDEGYAYDLLAICEVKISKKIKNAEVNYNSIFNELKDQIQNKHIEILKSEEYNELLKANQQTFDAVEEARYGSISAKEVDLLNMKRYECKKNLQLKFFPNSKVIEQKT